MSTTFKQALIKIRPLIKSGEASYICVALYMTDNFKFDGRIHRQLVDAMGNSCSSYEQWMYMTHRAVSRKMTARDYREGRLQWIDHMIAQETVL